MWAIRYKKTGEWLCGTNFDSHPVKHFHSFEFALTFNSYWIAEKEFYHRLLSSNYEIVKVELKEVGDPA